MKKYFCIVLLALLCFICQCGPKDMNERLASYIEHNEQNMERLRDWDIYFETERSFWSCRHWLSRDSLLSFLHIYVDQNNRFLHYSAGVMYEEDSVNTINNALQNINTLHGIMQECRFDGIGTHTVFNDTLGYDYCIVLMRDSLKYQLLHNGWSNSLDGKEQKLYNNWYIRNIPKVTR